MFKRIPPGHEKKIDPVVQDLNVWLIEINSSFGRPDCHSRGLVPTKKGIASKLGTKKHRGFSQHKRGRYMKNLSNEAGLVIFILD